MNIKTISLAPFAIEHFGLSDDPFTDDVLVPADDIFMTSRHDELIKGLIYGIERGKFMALVGEVGAGKTTILKELRRRTKSGLSKIMFVQPNLFQQRKLTETNLCESIIWDLTGKELSARGAERRARRVKDALKSCTNSGTRVCILLEEAQDLTIESLKLLKRVMEIGNDGYESLVSILLVGQTELQINLDADIHYDAREAIRRIQVSAIGPLTGKMEAYLDFKLRRVGGSIESVFDNQVLAAFDSILDSTMVSQCNPLLINNLCTLSMMMSAEAGDRIVTLDAVAAAMNLDPNRLKKMMRDRKRSAAPIVEKKIAISTRKSGLKAVAA